MSTPLKPWETPALQNNAQFIRSANGNVPSYGGLRSSPVLPPRPQSLSYSGGYNSYSPYSNYGSSYGSYGGMPYRNTLYGSGYGSYGGYGGYGSGYGSGYGMYGMGTGMGTMGNYGGLDPESRFIQFAEERSRTTFANVESIVRAFNSMAMMLDNTFFAMTSSFRAVLGVAENFGRLRSMFGHIWHALNIFRLVKWFYRNLMQAAGYKVPEGSKSMAWNEAINGAAAEAGGSAGSSWPTLAFLGVLLSAPYFISKFLPKYEDKLDPEKWKSHGIPAKVAFDFSSSSANELSVQINDEILLAPKSVQEEMKLTNSGWAYATCNGRCGVVPLNYIVIMKKNNGPNGQVPIARKPQKHVSFGENQVFDESRMFKEDKIESSLSEKRIFKEDKVESSLSEKKIFKEGKVESSLGEGEKMIVKEDKVETSLSEGESFKEDKVELSLGEGEKRIFKEDNIESSLGGNRIFEEDKIEPSLEEEKKIFVEDKLEKSLSQVVEVPVEN